MTIAIAPTILVATPISTARIDLTWVDNSSNEFEFRIERSDDNGNTYSQIGVAPMNTTTYSDLGLLPFRAYLYRVTAWNGAGSSPFGGPANATTLPLSWKAAYAGAGTPGIRADHSAIYDSLGRRMIVFGGQDDFNTFYNDVWALDLLQTTQVMTQAPLVNFWSQIAPAGTPPSIRFGHSAIYDTQNNRMIVFGGQDDTIPAANSYRNDVHILTLGATPSWTPATTSGTAPSGRLGHTAVYDAANQRMVVFGGNNATAPFEQADTKFLSLPLNPPFVWTNGPAGPVKRTEHSAIYDGLRQQMVIFAGLDNFPVPDGSPLNNDTWSLSLSGPSWAPVISPGTPSFRLGHSAVYDAANERMMVFGGDTTGMTTPSSELWTLRLAGSPIWTILNPSSGLPPPARFGHSAVYDSGRGRMVIFGGFDNTGFPNLADTWLINF